MPKDYKIIRENGKITDIEINGKPAKRSFVRAIREAQNTSYWHEFTSDGVARNPFSGVGVTLNPLELTIAKWCQQWYYNDYSRDYSNTEVPVKTYDNMKYFLLDLNSNAYMQLLD
jgi:hypothetical protein